MDERAAGKRCKNPVAGFLSPVARLRGNIFSGIRTGDRRVLEERKVDKGESGRRGEAGGQEGMDEKQTREERG